MKVEVKMMVKVECAAPVRVTKANAGMDYEFVPGKPVEVKEEHLKYLPAWGNPDSMFKPAEGEKKPERAKRKGDE
jgi:hypothetical protein